jgi:hypothetical protein
LNRGVEFTSGLSTLFLPNIIFACAARCAALIGRETGVGGGGEGKHPRPKLELQDGRQDFLALGRARGPFSVYLEYTVVYIAGYKIFGLF